MKHAPDAENEADAVAAGQGQDLDLDLALALWVIQLDSDDPIERAQAEQDFARWQQQHADRLDELEHFQEFAQQLQQRSSQVPISAQHFNTVLEEEHSSQHQLRRAFSTPLLILLLSMTLILLLGSWGNDKRPFDYYFADYKTAVGSPQSFVLEDGSHISLGAQSALKINFTATQRELVLVQGEIYVDVAKDPQRPFVVATAQARFEALGTRFLLQQYPEHSQIDMLHSKVRVQSNLAAQQVVVVQQGQRLYADPQGLSQAQQMSIQMAESAWQHGQIVAQDLALSDLLAQLNRHYPEYFVYSADAMKSFKINGVIDTQQDVDQILGLIMAQYPQLKVHRIAGRVLWVQMT